MSGKRNINDRDAVSVGIGVASNSTFSESLAFAMVTAVALISIVVGTWTILAFVSAHAGDGPISVAGSLV